ncbi:MAG TPA: signal peptidase I [Ktedonobacterales bacterium]|jgi:signal peptidase I
MRVLDTKDTPSASDYGFEDEQGEHWGARLLREVLEVAVLTLLIFMGIRLTVQNFRVDGPSMFPTLHNQQYILVNKVDYALGKPQRGDIIVFQAPDAALKQCPPADRDPNGTDFVKRIIGLPGDTVQLNPDGSVLVNSLPLQEPYLPAITPAEATHSWLLGKDEYLVFGDNRENSCDSRDWGPIHRSAIVGKALVVYWPLPDFHRVS